MSKSRHIEEQRLRLYREALEHFKSNGFVPLFTELDFINVSTPLKCRCNKHLSAVQEISYNGIRKKNRKFHCKLCLHDSLRTNIEYVYNIFDKNNLIPLFESSEYKDANTKLYYVCKKHQAFGKQYTTLYALTRKGYRGYVCKKCMAEYLSRIKTPKIRTERSRVNRDDNGYREWQKYIYKKYNWKCALCGCKGSKNNQINAHHIFGYKEYPDLRLDKNNGIVLCFKHHLEFHKKYGKEGNNLEQIEEFLGEAIENREYVQDI